MIFVTEFPHIGENLNTVPSPRILHDQSSLDLDSAEILACPLRKGDMLDDACEACQ